MVIGERTSSGQDDGPRHRAAGGYGLPPGARRVHFVGIGGIGMSGIAAMLSALGYEVSGSDLIASDATARLRRQGLDVKTGHDARWVGAADALVVSAAVAEDNAEVREALRRGLPVIPRGVMLAGLTRSRAAIAVTGTHGKSTTASMVAVMLAECGLDPSAVVGARIGAFGSNMRIGQGSHFVLEADESESSLLELSPRIAVLTNLEEEHLEHYGTFDRLGDTIVAFANRVVPTGTVVVCADDPALTARRPRILPRVVTYGLDVLSADIAGEQAVCAADGSHCQVRFSQRGVPTTLRLAVRVPGRHNLLNALAAFAVGLEVGLDPGRLVAALAGFSGIDRRFQLKGVVGGVRVVDDYAHHPTEVAAVLVTARRQRPERLVAVFQPHRFTRTARFLDPFAAALAAADVVVLTDVFAAGELPLPGAAVERLAAAVRGHGGAAVYQVHTLDDARALVVGLARPGDLIVTLGAGSIGGLGARLVASLRESTTRRDAVGGATPA